ncbi:MAG: hypothetical protein ABSE05_16465 [Syntrophales bacterium]
MFLYSLLFVSTCLSLFIPHNINAKVEVVLKMNELYVPFMVNSGPAMASLWTRDI